MRILSFFVFRVLLTVKHARAHRLQIIIIIIITFETSMSSKLARKNRLQNNNK